MARNFTSTDRVSVPSGADLFGESAASILGWFKVPASSTTTFIYHEVLNFNEEIYARLNSTGFFEFFWRTPTALIVITGASALDDGVWRRFFCVRRANNDFQAYVNGTSIGTASNNPGTISISPTIYIGNNAGGASEAGASVARLITLKRAITVNEAEGILYTGRVGGTKNLHLELGLGSPEPDFSGNKFNGTVTGTTIVGNPPMQPMAA